MHYWILIDCNDINVLGYDAGGSLRYTFHDIEETWNDARNSCLTLRGDLASITSERENEIITTNLNGSWWIGLNKEETGDWVWSNEAPVNWFNFHRNHTTKESSGLGGSTLGKDCAAIKSVEAGHWVGESCNGAKHRYVCKYEGKQSLILRCSITTLSNVSCN